MKTKNHLRAWIILGIYVAATCALLFLGYSVQSPKIVRQEFPFSITYNYQGTTETISDVYVGEYIRKAKYMGDESIAWHGYIKDHDMREPDYYTIEDFGDRTFSINLNIIPGYLMGDPAYAGLVCEPIGQYNSFDGTNDNVTTDPAELEQLGFSVVSWAYPAPIENAFSFGGISLSSEACAYAAAIAVAALLLSLILIRKDLNLTYGKLDKTSVVLNFALAIFAFPFILATGMFSELVAGTSAWQQLLYFAPALTAFGIAASVMLRRLGQKVPGFMIQLAGPAAFALALLFEMV